MELSRRRPVVVEAQPWRPTFTYGLLAACGAMFVLELVVLGSREDLFGAIFLIDTDWPARPWSLLTSTLSHGGFPHLLLNGLFLFFFGPTVERILGHDGRGALRYLTLFFVAGAVSGVAQVHLEAAVHPAGTHGALGASGALMALFGVIMVLLPRQTIMVYGLLPVPMWAAGIGYALLDVVGAVGQTDNVGHFAHLSGMALGLGYGAWLKADLRKRGLHLVRA